MRRWTQVSVTWRSYCARLLLLPPAWELGFTPQHAVRLPPKNSPVPAGEGGGGDERRKGKPVNCLAHDGQGLNSNRLLQNRTWAPVGYWYSYQCQLTWCFIDIGDVDSQVLFDRQLWHTTVYRHETHCVHCLHLVVHRTSQDQRASIIVHIKYTSAVNQRINKELLFVIVDSGQSSYYSARRRVFRDKRRWQ